MLMARNRKKSSNWVVAVVVAALLVITLAMGLPQYLLSFVKPPIKWIRPYLVHLEKMDCSEIFWKVGPFAYTRCTTGCECDINRDIYFSPSKPSYIKSNQWKWEEREKSWMWAFDYQDDVDCAPNLGIFAKEVSSYTDPATGIATIRYSVQIVLSCDAWLGDVNNPASWPGMECGTKFLDSYVKLQIHPPYHVLSVQLDGRYKEFHYEADGSRTILIPVKSVMPASSPSYMGEIYGIPIPFWLKTGVSFEHVVVLRVQTEVVETAATITLVPEELEFPTEFVTTHTHVEGGGFEGMWPQTVYTKLVPVTTTETITEYATVTAYETVYYGQTITKYKTLGYTTYVYKPVKITVYKPTVVKETITAKKTATIIVTQEVQVEVPTELQKIIKVIPFWALAAIGVLTIIAMAMGVYMMGARARARRATGGRRRRR